MFNLIKMNLFRMIRTKSFYIIFAILSLFIVIVIASVGNFAGDATAMMEYFGLDVSRVEYLSILNLYFENGVVGLIIAIAVSIFVCTDYSSGYIKNIASGVTRKSNITIANFATWVIGTAIYFIGMVILLFVMGSLFIGNVVVGNVAEVLSYVGMLYFMTLVIISFMTLVTSYFRSSAASITMAVVVIQFAEIIYWGIKNLTSVDLSEYSIFANINQLSMRYESGWNTLIVCGTIYLIGYLIVSCVVMEKKDI